ANDTSLEIKSAKNAAIKVSSDLIELSVRDISTSFNDKLNIKINEERAASQKFTTEGIEQVVSRVNEVNDHVSVLRSSTEATIKNLSDRVITEVNGLTTKDDNLI